MAANSKTAHVLKESLFMLLRIKIIHAHLIKQKVINETNVFETHVLSLFGGNVRVCYQSRQLGQEAPWGSSGTS